MLSSVHMTHSSYAQYLGCMQAFRESAAVAAEEVVFKTFPQKVRAPSSSSMHHSLTSRAQVL